MRHTIARDPKTRGLPAGIAPQSIRSGIAIKLPEIVALPVWPSG